MSKKTTAVTEMDPHEVTVNQKGLVRKFYGELTLRNSAKTLYASAAEGADLVKSAAGSVIDGFTASPNIRNENFSEACDRLGIEEQQIPLIHNQLVLQFYISFFIGVIALAFFGNFIVMESPILVKLTALGAAAASFGNACQASLQSYKVRSLSLNAMSYWIAEPSEWFPSRMNVSNKIDDGDSRKNMPMTKRAIHRSQLFYFVASAIFLFSIPGFFLDNLIIPKLHYTTIAFAVFFFVLAIKNSFLSMQSTTSEDCDFMSWLLSPEYWIPVVSDEKRDG